VRRWHRVVAAGFVAGLVLAPTAALAHEGQVIRLGSFLAGLTHPVLGLVAFAIVAIYPISQVIGISLRPGDRLYTTSLALIPEDATLDAYRQVIFEKDFKRNYIHVRDVADCFVHCIEHSERMAGRPYNAGLNDANLSKEELALKIKEYVPSYYVQFAQVGTDPDKRNYIVSNDRLKEAGFEAQRSLDDGIQELLKGYRMLGRAPFKNV